MSGYAGLVRPRSGEGAAAEDAQRVEQMAKAIAFRGPDSQNLLSLINIHCCFSLLKTGPAPQSRKQPFSINGRIWLLGDVRLDGRGEIFRRFEQYGEKLEQTLTDEELILNTFQIFGEQGVAALDGDFSFVLWDSKREKLLGFRDLTGGKPFFYLAGKGLLGFSNTLEALRFCPGFTGDLDGLYLGDYLLSSWCQHPERTVYQQIRRLPPGHMLEFSQERLLVHRVAQLPIEEMLKYKREEDYFEQYRELLQNAVRDRLPDEPTVVFMSGGLDSTTVAAEANRVSKKAASCEPVRALAVEYRPLFDDQEAIEARPVANYLGIPFEVLTGGEVEPFSGWDRLGWRMPEPLHEAFFAFHLEKHRKTGTKARVALSGDGGDDVLLGQAWPYLRGLLQKGKFVTAAGGLLRHVWNNRTIPVLGLGIRSGIQRRFGAQKQQEIFPIWVLPDFETKLNLRERFRDLQKRPTSAHPIHPRAYSMLTGPFWPSVLEGEDAAWSGVALEVREPLLDRRMVRYLLKLPAMPFCQDKYLVRRAMKGALPRETSERPKTPLARDPLEVWLREKGWKPLPLLEKSLLQAFVDVQKLESFLGSSNWATVYENLRPLSLGLWLKSVETHGRIQ